MDLDSVKNDSVKPLILLVDDAPKNIQILGYMLSCEGFEISVAISGKQALSIVNNRPPDLILLDVMMPDLNGFEVCSQIKSNKNTSNIPIIFVSASEDVESKLKGFEAGAADYITKPFQSIEVIARVHTHLALKEAIQTVNKYNIQLEMMLEERTKELIKTERHAAFSLLIQGIVHNLRNPLSGVSGGAEMILLNRELMKKRGVSIPSELIETFDDVWKYADMIFTSSKKLVFMIDSLMSKSKSDKTDNIEIINLNDIIDQEINFLFADQRFRHNVKKTIKLSDNKLMLEIVPSELSQIFLNLVKNAMDAMFSQENAEISIITGKENETVWISIEDNGSGIPKNIQSKIFDPFFSTKPKASSAIGNEPIGTGLGLHTCSQMIRSYKGLIEMDSKVGRGTKFKIYFPRIKEI